MTTTRFGFAIAGLSLVALAGTASGNIILNPGFEAGAGTDAADWAEIVGGAAGSVERSSIDPDTGSFHAAMTVDHINNFEAAGAYFIEQNQPVGSIDNSLNYDLTFRAKTASMDFTGMDTFYQVLWLDQDASHGGGVKGEFLVGLIGEGINTSYQTFSMLDIDVPDGTDSFLIRFQLSAGPVPGIQNSLYVDNASLAPVPAPASMLVLAGFAAIRRRR